MNRTFLGDALDHWKGSLIRQLQDEGLVRNLAVDPMLTDAKKWSDDEVATYARLLHVRRGQVLSRSARLAESRTEHFKKAGQHQGDIFLDPDTGIRTGRVKAPERYVATGEIGELLSLVPERLLMVYQHGARAQGLSSRIETVIRALRDQTDCPFCWSSYESGTVAMLFLSRTYDRTHGIAQHFRGKLGSCAERIQEGSQNG